MIHIIEVQNAADTFARLNSTPPELTSPYVALDQEQTAEEGRDMIDYNKQRRHNGNATSVNFIPDNTFNGGMASDLEEEQLDGGVSDINIIEDVFYLR